MKFPLSATEIYATPYLKETYMGMRVYTSALFRATHPQAPSRANIKETLRTAGLRIGWRGLVTASRCMSQKQYQGLLKFIKAVSDDVKMEFTLSLPALSITLGNAKNPPIDFEQLAAEKHVKQIVTEFFNFRSQTLDLEFLPAYIRRVRHANG